MQSIDRGSVTVDYAEIFGTDVAESRQIDWAEVELAYGSRLPADYRAFAETYPALYYGRFITILHPLATNVYANLIECGQDALRMWTSVEQVAEGSLPYRFFPAPGGLLPWGYDDDNGHYFWRTEGEPAEWTVVVTESFEWWEYSGGFGAFWGDLVAGKINAPVIRKDLPGDDGSVKKFGASSD